jgi:uncharacterized protein involved in response to NO
MMPPVFRHGFRPFFLIAGGWALIAMLLWTAILHGAALPEGLLNGAHWHAHEMIAGFIGAAMGGFLLTAVPNWTGRPGYGGAPVMLVAGLFVLARLVLLPGMPISPPLAATLALLPVPALLTMILPAIVAAGTPRLFGPPALILLFWVGDLLMLGDAAGWFAGTWTSGQLLALDVALALVGLIGGRILPAFTLNALRKAGTPVDLQPLPGLDRAGILALLLIVAVDQVAPGGPVAGSLAAIAAVLAALRLSRWHGLRTGHDPLLWVLHLAYSMVPVALCVKAMHLLTGAAWSAAWLHLQGAGAIALMILAVMTRATLGHTGRALVATAPITAAYLLLFAASLMRGFGPALFSAGVALTLAALLWVAAFAVFLATFSPMLVTPRPDGRPG